MKKIVESPRSLAEIGAILLISFRASRDLQERKVLRALLKRLDPRIVKGIRSTVPKKHKDPSKWRNRSKRDYQYDTQQRIMDLQQGTWKSANAQGWAYKRPQERSGCSRRDDQPQVASKVDSTPVGSSMSPSVYSPVLTRSSQMLVTPRPAAAPCPVPKAVEVQPGALTALQAMRCGLPVTPDRTKYRDGVWCWCLPE